MCGCFGTFDLSYFLDKSISFKLVVVVVIHLSFKKAWCDPGFIFTDIFQSGDLLLLQLQQ